MSNARFRSVSVQRFKSHATESKIPTGALTVLIGRNNSGKSSIVQALMLLKQTLEFPRVDVPLHLEGMVEALSIRELTYGWPRDGEGVSIGGPAFVIRWQSDIDTAKVIDRIGSSAFQVMASRPETPWISSFETSGVFQTETEIFLDYGEVEGRLVLRRIRLHSFDGESTTPRLSVEFHENGDGDYSCVWNGAPAKSVNVTLDHFIPFISIDTRNIGPRDRQRAWANTFSAVFLQPLDDLRSLIKSFSYLSSARALPPAIYKFSSVAPDSIGVAGEFAAQLLHINKDKEVSYSSPDSLDGHSLPLRKIASLQEAVNEVLAGLGIEPPLAIEEIRNVGFRLLFGQANLQHVGRGLTYLLPIVELGLVSDPTLFQSGKRGGISFEDANSSICAFEEPEAHLHPKIQSRLAEWFVALALMKRQIFVETHSDHLVRKLRSLIARAKSGSEFEKWLASQVVIVQVDQSAGVSSVRPSYLSRDGAIEDWPSDFLDQALNVEEEIYVAALGKAANEKSPGSKVEHLAGDEPDESAN